MKILALDDEPLALEMLCEAIAEAQPDAEVTPFADPYDLLEYAAQNPCDAAFLDIHVQGMTGIELAKRLKEQAKERTLNLIFVTGYEEYTADAMALHASGYLLKPVTAEKIAAELADLRYPPKTRQGALLQCRCFGSFEAFTPDGALLHFERSKAKEVLAYLVYRTGAACSIKDLAAALFEGDEWGEKQRGNTQKAVSSLVGTLKAAGAGEVIIKKYNCVAINTALIDCDYYSFARLDPAAVNAYHGEFMTQYPWAEFVLGYLERVLHTL